MNLPQKIRTKYAMYDGNGISVPAGTELEYLSRGDKYIAAGNAEFTRAYYISSPELFERRVRREALAFGFEDGWNAANKYNKVESTPTTRHQLLEYLKEWGGEVDPS